MSKKIFTVNVARCSGCYNCQLACKDEHSNNDWRPYAAPQPPAGQFWCRVKEYVHGTIPKVRIHYEARLCGHCDGAECIASCPVDAIYRRDDGLVLIDPGKCTGCGACVSACPYDTVFFNDELGIAQKCTGCAHLLDNGAVQPRCVEACPTDAMSFGDEGDFDPGLLKKALKRGNVYYLNIPGRFIAGTLYDPVEEEVVIGARCVLSSAEGKKSAFSDSYGDFWFNDLPEGEFSLTVEAEGYLPFYAENLVTDKDINLGDMALSRA